MLRLQATRGSIFTVFYLLASLLMAPWPGRAATNEFWLYIGTYTGHGSEGIYVARYQSDTGMVSAPRLAAKLPNPAFLDILPQRRLLLTALDVGTNGGIATLDSNPETGDLMWLAERHTGSRGICHVSFDRSGRVALAVSYGSGRVFAWPVYEDGTLGDLAAHEQHTGHSVHPRQAGPHAHQIVTDPANRFAYVCDLGLDQIRAYRLDPVAATLTPVEPPFTSVTPGSGPRHLAFSPNGRWVYVVNEIACTLTVFAFDPDTGRLRERFTVSTLPPGVGVGGTNTAAEVGVAPSGRDVYVSTRGVNTITRFRVNPVTGQLTDGVWVSTGGRTPRCFTLDPTGGHLIVGNQDSGSVRIFKLDAVTGVPVDTGRSWSVSSPVSFAFLPVGGSR